MSAGSVQVGRVVPLPVAAEDTQAAERRESRVRRVLAACIALGFGASIIGVGWDVQWHAAVGRDSFFIPSHLMLYSGVIIAGVLSLALVLRDSRLWRKPGSGVSDANTVHVLGRFYGPIGFIVCGFGMLTLLIAAPFDNDWHELYGIDVTVWAAFHVMGILGAAIGGLGLIYMVASEANRAAAPRPAAEPRPWSPLNGLVVAALAFLLPAPMVLLLPAALQWPTTEIGPLAFLTYPVMVALMTPLVLIAAVRFTGRVGAATLVGLLFTALRLAMVWLAPALTSLLATALHETYRPYAPEYPLVASIYPAWMIVGGLVVDGVYWLAARRSGAPAEHSLRPALIGGVLAMLAMHALDALVVMNGWDLLWDRVWWRPLSMGHDPGYVAMALTLGTLLIVPPALFSAWLGNGLGTVLRVVRQ